MCYQRQAFEGVLQNECSWGFRGRREWEGVPVLVSLFDKVACLMTCEFIVGRPVNFII